METEPGTTTPDGQTASENDRREFFKKALTVCAYAAPIVMSFSSRELVRASSSPDTEPDDDEEDDDD